MDKKNDRIELLLPLKAEYVSVARLTTSGISSRVGFDIDTIEDIKVAVSEVCNKILSKGSSTAASYKILYSISGNKLNIVFNCEDKSLKCVFDNEDDKLGISIITALMDEVELCSGSEYLLSMSKALEGNI